MLFQIVLVQEIKCIPESLWTSKPGSKEKVVHCCENCDEMFIQHDNELLCSACTE